MLYKLTHTEITNTLTIAAEKWPQLARRINAAEDLLQAQQFHFDFNLDCWVVASASELGKNYRVTTGKYHSCTCPHFLNKPDYVQGRPLCKHTICILAYIWTLNRHLKGRILGTTKRADRRKAELHPDLWLLRISESPTITNLIEPPIYFRTRWSQEDRRAILATDADAAIFAQWLHHAPPMSLILDLPISQQEELNQRAEWHHLAATHQPIHVASIQQAMLVLDELFPQETAVAQ